MKNDRGWGDVRPRDRVAHYYVGGMSLCNKVGFYNGPLLDTGDRIWPDDCKACARKLARLNAPKAQQSFKVGDKVHYHPIIGGPSDGQVYTISVLEKLNGKTPVAWLHEKRGCVSQSAISPVLESDGSAKR